MIKLHLLDSALSIIHWLFIITINELNEFLNKKLSKGQLNRLSFCAGVVVGSKIGSLQNFQKRIKAFFTDCECLGSRTRFFPKSAWCHNPSSNPMCCWNKIVPFFQQPWNQIIKKENVDSVIVLKYFHNWTLALDRMCFDCSLCCRASSLPAVLLW